MHLIWAEAAGGRAGQGWASSEKSGQEQQEKGSELDIRMRRCMRSEIMRETAENAERQMVHTCTGQCRQASIVGGVACWGMDGGARALETVRCPWQTEVACHPKRSYNIYPMRPIAGVSGLAHIFFFCCKARTLLSDGQKRKKRENDATSLLCTQVAATKKGRALRLFWARGLT